MSAVYLFAGGLLLGAIVLVWLFHDYVAERPESQGWRQS